MLGATADPRPLKSEPGVNAPAGGCEGVRGCEWVRPTDPTVKVLIAPFQFIVDIHLIVTAQSPSEHFPSVVLSHENQTPLCLLFVLLPFNRGQCLCHTDTPPPSVCVLV